MEGTTTSTAPSLVLLYTPIRTNAPTPDGLSCPPLLFLFFFFFFCIFFLWARGKQTDLLKHPSSLVCRCGFEGRTLCPAIQKSRTKKKKSPEKEALHHRGGKMYGGEEASEEEVTVCLSMSVAIKEACEMF